jgi:transposase-like protein
MLAVLGNAGNTWVVPPRLTDAQKEEARRRRAEGATLAELARSYDVSMSTISRL